MKYKIIIKHLLKAFKPREWEEWQYNTIFTAHQLRIICNNTPHLWYTNRCVVHMGNKCILARDFSEYKISLEGGWKAWNLHT